ncbi:MAG: FimV/HubP family polar landmark protein [Burkholderiales bacterium]|nr:FimV/HubP family polar landmark protein [Burkholderiales bacterium]
MRISIVVRGLAALLVFASFAASAAGLGTLRVLSALGQPLRAEIDIVSLRRGEQETLSVRLASSEAYRQAGVEFHPALIGINLEIQRRDGKPIVMVTTREPVNEPFLETLIELEWAAGRLVREYTILLDPPTYIPPPPAGAVMGPTAPAAAAPPQPIAPSAEPTPPAAGAPAVVNYEVVKGDTLSKIALEHMHGGVTFNQMMIAIYRANQEAFIRENINLVRAGRILRIPDRDEVAAVGRDEARETVLAHMASFAEYRRQIAAAAPTAPEAAGTRTAEGQITTDAGKAAPDGTRDQLRLSRAEPDKADAGGAGAAAAREDDRVARDRELEEAQSRVTELEKNITDLQKLLEIKNQQIAQLEQSAAAAPAKPAAEAPKPAPEAPKPAAETPKPAAEAPKPAAEAPKPKPAAEAPKPKPAPARPQPAPQPAPSLLDEYLGDPLMLGGLGLVILLLAGYGAYAWKRKKRTAQGQLGDSLLGVAAAGGTAAAGASAGAAVAAAGGVGMPEAEEVDPLAEADVYLAYGRDAQAEEILREAMQKDANRPAVHGKLLEIYAKRRDPRQFEATAQKLKTLVKGEGPEWDKATALGRSIDPGNSLYGEGEAAAVVPDFRGREAAPAVDFNIEATSTGIDRKAADVTLDFDLGGTTSEEPAAARGAGAERPKVDVTGPLDFDLGTTTTEKSAASEAQTGAAADGGGGLDFELNLDSDEAPGAHPRTVPSADATGDFGAISLDLGGGEADAGAPGAGDAKWQEVATKLDLAKAYEEMGDKDGARELLNEVAREGDAAQQAQAQQMLATLG